MFREKTVDENKTHNSYYRKYYSVEIIKDK